ncbi:uncharacterized protein LOC129963003 [Argiope bruennichi]|uniref:uncharacterized protein LOC129963003 n=1 Tax=Argiope bruennichi TaxID=94029 RepID=UPI0024957CB3|nr:uncharacterized protein LOC129963003 [Argiope bruennichi]
MAFIAKARKCDLQELASELGEEIDGNLTIANLRKLILNSNEYEEEFVKGVLEGIVERRQEKENLERREKERQFELEKIKLQTSIETQSLMSENNEMNTKHNSSELQKILQKFDSKNDDISLYLVIFERQAKRLRIDKTDWVTQLMPLLPSEVVQIIAREPEEESNVYEYVKELLLRRFKLSAETFRLRFVQHQKRMESSWRDLAFELRSFLEEWLDGVNVTDFDSLKDLMVVDQMKRRVGNEVREHFVDTWTKISSSSKLADLLDDYDGVRRSSKTGHIPSNGRTRVNGNFEKRNPIVHDKNAMNTDYKRPSSPRNWKQERSDRRQCFECGSSQHLRAQCPNLAKMKNFSRINRVTRRLVETTSEKSGPQRLPENVAENQTDEGTILTTQLKAPEKEITRISPLQKIPVKIEDNTFEGIVDTGAEITVIRQDIIDSCSKQGEGSIKIISAFGEEELAPLVTINVKINDGKHGNVPVTCAASKKLISDMLISSTTYEALCKKIEAHTLLPVIKNVDSEQPVHEEPNQEDNEESPLEEKICFSKLQKEDNSLKTAWAFGSSQQNGYSVEDGILSHSEWVCGEKVQQVVLPECKRKCVLKAAHELPLAGHLGERKTKERIKYSFYWPGIKKDVKEFCQSCKQCQVRRAITYRDRIPIQPIVRPENPFEVWSIDCIGPLEPPSRRGHKFIICAIDLCTRWAEAIPVRNITAKTTCDVLMKIFTATGFPEVVCTDQGTNFTSTLTKEFLKVIGTAPRFATPGHPESMGAVERWNKTLKEMLSKNIQENGKDWDIHLPYLLFAYREVPHSTTGLSPFQMVYGRLPRGPLSLMKDFWTGKRRIPVGVSRSIESYLENLQENLGKAHGIAMENAEKTQAEYARRYNLRAREKTFQVGEKVLILDSASSHKLLKKWIGPVSIVAFTRPHSVLVKMEDGTNKEIHVNKIRPYIARLEQVGVIYDQDNEFGEIFPAPTNCNQKSKISRDIRTQIYNQGKELSLQQKAELIDILSKYTDSFSKFPGKAKVPGHNIKVTDDCVPKRLAPYRVPIVLQGEVERQVQELLEAGLIEHSESDWAHPVVCVAKKNGSIRLCVDYRQLNKYTIADAYPMKLVTELLYEIGKASFISILDLTKGYWQIPMKPEAKHYTAFITHSGLYQWNVMPFGMKNAGSTFQRSMDKILSKHREYCRAYIDDVAIFSKSWEEHKKHIMEVFCTLQESNLTINLEKCEFGKKEVKFLGHIVGSGRHSPDPEKIDAIKKLLRPTNKKEVRSLLGLANYYRDYIPNFSSLVLPLTNLTKKNVPNKIPWAKEQEQAFQILKEELVKMPSLYTPQLDKPFQLYTDASATAVGACLAQIGDDGKEKPIAFFSKKLTATQTRWATIEREAYAVLEALKKYDTWIFGARVQVISDHNPLTYLTQQTPHSAKLTRWSLALQRYDVTISYRKGSKHCNADSLSRLPLQQ